MILNRACLLAALPALLLAGCGRGPEEANNAGAMNESQADAALDEAMNGVEDGNAANMAGTLVPPAPGEEGGLPDDREPLNEGAARDPTSVEASGGTIERWGLALSEGRYGDAYRLWRDDGRRSGMSEAQFADAYRTYAEIHVLVGRPEAGGTQTARVPVQMYGRRRDGSPFNMLGMMTLARNPAGQAGEAGEAPWLITASELRARGRVKIIPADADTTARMIPPAFRGNWSRSATTCGKPGDDMRLAVAADSLTFYESVGAVKTVKRLAPGRIELTADYNGEGDKWTDTATLALSNGGNSLTIGPVRRVRCV
jgi:hypothetical protein